MCDSFASFECHGWSPLEGAAGPVVVGGHPGEGEPGVVPHVGHVEGVLLLPPAGVLADHEVLGPLQAVPPRPEDVELQVEVLQGWSEVATPLPYHPRPTCSGTS